MKAAKRSASKPKARVNRVAVRPHERAKPRPKAEPPPQGAGHAVENLLTAFPELKR